MPLLFWMEASERRDFRVEGLISQSVYSQISWTRRGFGGEKGSRVMEIAGLVEGVYERQDFGEVEES